MIIQEGQLLDASNSSVGSQNRFVVSDEAE